MKELIFVISMFILTLNSCVKENLLKVETASSKSLNAAQQEALNDGLMIVKNLSTNKKIQYYETVPESFKSKIKTELNAKSVKLYVDKEKKMYYYIYHFSETGAFINSLGSCSKKFVEVNINRKDCTGQGSECDILTNPDGSWELIICTL